MRFCSLPLKEIIVTRFEAGEDLLSGINQVVLENDVSAGMFSVIGAIDTANYGFYIPAKKDYTALNWVPSNDSSPALEILSCIGNVALLNDKPVVHAHITLAGVKGEMIGGHLLEGCRVNPTAELTLLKAEGKLQREHNDMLNLALLSI
ncbi:MAG: PPC domain-containing DNA-binding protein [Candidatus Thorarchaeota archaeon]